MKISYKTRIYIIEIIFCLLAGALVARLWKLQIIEGASYANNFELKITKTLTQKAVRGNIYDAKGQKLAYNQLVYNINMIDNGEYASNRERQLQLNSMIYRVQEKIRQEGGIAGHGLKIAIASNGNYTYTVEGKALLRFQADIFGKPDSNKLTTKERQASAKDLMQYLSENERFALYGEGKKAYTQEELTKYNLKSSYTKEEELSLLGVRYMLSLHEYRKYQPIILASDISQEMMAYISENSMEFPGITIEEDWKRVYEGGEAFGHLLGYTGQISTEERENLQMEGQEYSLTAIIGKTGLEQYLETKLQGKEGAREVWVNNMGKIKGEGKIIREAQAGEDVFLSIDKELQIAIYQMLEQGLADILVDHLIDAKSFDKSNVTDAANIRIPIYEVYMAFIENEVIDMEFVYAEARSDLEEEIVQKMISRQEKMTNEIRDNFHSDESLVQNLSQEMKDFLEVILLDESLFSKENAQKLRLLLNEKPQDTLKESMIYAIEEDWINRERISSTQKYLFTSELYELFMEEIVEVLQENKSARNLMFRHLLLSDEIQAVDICKLLYEQGILEDQEEDYEKFMAGSMSPYTLLKKKISERAITPAQLALEPCSASAVVVQAETGKVLACVSYPGYQSNRLANQMDTAYYQELLSNQSLPLYNRATQQLAAPGSTLKPITIIAGLNEGVSYADTAILCDGTFDKVEPALRCWNRAGHGLITNVAMALQTSCNDYLCEISYRLGLKDGESYNDEKALSYLQEYAQMFDLHEKSGVEIPENSPQVTTQYGIHSAIGQGTHNYATVQLARYVNTLATRGKSFSLSLIQDTPPLLQSQVQLPPFIWDVVAEGMNQYAQTSTFLQGMAVTAAGKTGTAQEAKDKADHTLLVAYAPATNPEISIAVRIVNGYDTSYVTKIGRDIFNHYFELLPDTKVR